MWGGGAWKGRYQPPTPAESHGTTPSASNTIVPPTVPDISNLSLEINEAVDVRPIDSISTVSPLLHSTPSTLTAPHIREHDRIGRKNIRDVTIITDRNEAQPSSPLNLHPHHRHAIPLVLPLILGCQSI